MTGVMRENTPPETNRQRPMNCLAMNLRGFFYRNGQGSAETRMQGHALLTLPAARDWRGAERPETQ